MRLRPGLFLSLFALLTSHLVAAGVEVLTASSPEASTSSFPLVVNGAAAPIVLPSNAPKVIQIVAGDLADDIARVTGVRPAVLATPPPAGQPRVLLAFPADLTGHWEAFRLSASADTLSVEGSDPRGLAYGLFEISRRIGVSPWYWWADVPTVHRDELRLSQGIDLIDRPAVKFRGIFINDEDWGLNPWASKTFEPKVGTIGPKTYAKVCELLLRLRANTLWPAMHTCTTPFFEVPGNAAVIDAYDIVLGSSHTEPMFRNNEREWRGGKGGYNFLTHGAQILDYWEQRVKERTSGDSIFTIGMRGMGDSPIIGPKTQAERVATLEKVFAAQRGILARDIGHGDATKVPQMFCPYKEVLPDYEAGLKVPDDVTILWPDDNFGYIRRFPTPAERGRSGGGGVYYHLSYLGAPMAWTWLDTLPPALVWEEMTKAYEQGDRTLWIANVGDIKCTERSAEYFLGLAWRADRTSPEDAQNFLLSSSARDFGATEAPAIASILDRSQRLATARKPEHLQWNLPKTPYEPTALTEPEIQARLAAYTTLVADTRAVAAHLPADTQDAFFELVAYPVESAAAVNARYFEAELARLQYARGDKVDASATFALSEAAEKRAEELTRHYNDDIAGGKWRHIVMVGGIGKKIWPGFQPAKPASLNETADAVRMPASAASQHTPLTPQPSDARPGDFYETAGVVSIVAGHFTSRNDVPGGGGWRVIPGLGRTGDAVAVLPTTLAGTPSLSYRFHNSTAAAPVIHVRLLPTYPIVPGRGLRLALAIDNGPALPLAVTGGFDNKSKSWAGHVLTNSTETSLKLDAPLAPGWHTLRLVAVDTGVVVDKIVLDLGGLRPSYDDPAETRVPSP